MIRLNPVQLALAALCALAIGGAIVQTVRLERARASFAGQLAEAQKAVASAVAAAIARQNDALARATAAQAQLEEMAADIDQARAARAAAERKLFDAFDRDLDLSRPGLPAGVRAEIKAHWGAR